MDKIIEKLNQALTPEEIDTLFGEACRRYEWLRFTVNGASIERVADIYDKDIDPNPKKRNYLNGKFKRFVLPSDLYSFACELDSRNLPRLGRVLYNTYFAKYEGGAS